MARPKLNKVVKTISISENTVNQMNALAEKYNRNISTLIEDAIDEYYRKRMVDE